MNASFMLPPPYIGGSFLYTGTAVTSTPSRRLFRERLLLGALNSMLAAGRPHAGLSLG